MRRSSSLTRDQRLAVIALFEDGYGRNAVATHLGLGRDAVGRLHERWRLRGSEALMEKKSKARFSFETKREVVRRFLAGETKLALAQEFGIATPRTVTAWARIYRRDGEEGLRPKPKGRPRKDPDAQAPELTELERLRQENEYLRAENAYLVKLKALMAQKPR